MRSSLLFLLTLLLSSLHAQQFSLDWAATSQNGVSRVVFASNGDLFTLGSGSDQVKLQRYSSIGALLWTKTLSAPTISALDMDVDGNDNVFVYLGFTTGQLDLDPGPFTTLVNPGKVYAKYNSNGQYQWGFSVANTTDLSSSYGGLTCDDAGNLYIAGDLGQGTYDMDPGPGVHDLVVGSSAGGVFIARYRPDGTLHWANLRHWPNGFTYTRAIAAMPNGAGFYVVQRLDDGGALSGQIDVDPGPGTHLVYNQSINLLRYDSTFAFVARANAHFGEQKLAADDAGNVYQLASAYSGGGQWAVKYSTSGQILNEVYQTALPGNGNIRLAGIVSDGQGGSMGAYSTNCTANYYRFFKMNVSGLVDHNFSLYSGSDCTYPIVRGFAVRGSTFAIGSINQGYTVDLDPGAAVVSLPTGSDRGAVALYDWCGGVPYDPFDIDVLTSEWCLSDTVALAVDAFGDATSYTWDAGVWDVVAGQGDTVSYVVATSAGPATISVGASNLCGTSAPATLQLVAGEAHASLPADSVACGSMTTILDPGPCVGCTYLWMPGGETTATLPVDIDSTVTYIVSATHGQCVASDTITLAVEICTGLADGFGSGLRVSPVPALRGQHIVVAGLQAGRTPYLTTIDGRHRGTLLVEGDRAVVATGSLAPGMYLLHGAASTAVRLVVQ